MHISTENILIGIRQWVNKKINDVLTGYIENNMEIISNVLVNHQNEINEQKQNIESIDTVLSNVVVNHENDIEALDNITSNVLVNHEEQIQTLNNNDVILANVLVNYENRIKTLEQKIAQIENNTNI